MEYNQCFDGIHKNTSLLTRKDIDRIESEVGFSLPEDYKHFLMTVNGCEGTFNGKNYAILWCGNDLAKYNKEYQVSEFIEGMLFIGSNGGGEAFAFDGLNNMSVVRVPFIGMERDLSEPVAANFADFITFLCEKTLYE